MYALWSDGPSVCRLDRLTIRVELMFNIFWRPPQSKPEKVFSSSSSRAYLLGHHSIHPNIHLKLVRSERCILLVFSISHLFHMCTTSLAIPSVRPSDHHSISVYMRSIHLCTMLLPYIWASEWVYVYVYKNTLLWKYRRTRRRKHKQYVVIRQASHLYSGLVSVSAAEIRVFFLVFIYLREFCRALIVIVVVVVVQHVHTYMPKIG